MSKQPNNVETTAVAIPVSSGVILGDLTMPSFAKGIVIFAHGSGSNRNSPRNRYVAGILQKRSRFATLLIDLMTAEENHVDSKRKNFRFDIDFLARHLIEITEWVSKKNSSTENLAIGYYATSTGTAAAIVSATKKQEERVLIKAIVSRGGRPEFAGVSSLRNLRCPILLLIGGADNRSLIAAHRRVMRNELKSLDDNSKKLVVIPDAGHLFEEPNTLEEVSLFASSWFEKYLNS